MNADQPAWERARVPRERWLQAVRTALKRHVEAANRRGAFYDNAGETIQMSEEEDRLRVNDEEAERVWRDAMAGDRAVIAKLLEGK
jgi:hypothetical protein